MRTRAIVGALLVLLAVGCQYRNQPEDGFQACEALPGKQCPDGYHCASDLKCWHDGHNPIFSVTPDAATDGPSDLASPESDASRDLAADTTTEAGPPACSSGMHTCSGTCVSNMSIDHCGLSCDKCMPPTGGTSTCDGNQCDFDCGSLKKCNSKCVSECCVDGDCPTQGGKVGQCDTSTYTCSYQNCATDFKPCGSACIAKSACCSANDCTGTCMTCSGPGGTCVAVKSQDDTDSCPGTCDASGACKSKQGQTCQTSSGGCIAGSTCAPDGYCCDTACAQSCMACDIPGFLGKCTAVASGTPHGNRTSCGTDPTCGGSCSGRTDGLCTYPTGTCGAGPHCSNTNFVDQSTCAAGSCVAPSAQACLGGYICSGTACENSCTSDADCLPSYFCAQNRCHLDAKAVSAAVASTCALLVDGSVWCWGNCAGCASSSTIPVKVQGMTKPATAIAAGDAGQACAILNDTSVACWGSNSLGALGNNSTADSPTPVAVSGLTGVTKISATSHVCAVTTNGSVWCWGWNSFGQLGSPTSSDHSGVPLQVPNLGNAVSVGTADVNTCAVRQDGTITCWGQTPAFAAQVITFSPAPTAIVMSDHPQSLHACLLTAAGSVLCWGSDSNGQLGDGMTGTSSSSALDVSGLQTGAMAIAAGGMSSCALLADGTIKCWGSNILGQLGNNGTVTNYPQPVNVVGLTGATAITVGEFHACAVTSNGSVQCWGYNGNGQLGSGNGDSTTVPVPVIGW